jgi:hypothetical protein
MCDALTFNLTQAQFDALRAEAVKQGIVLGLSPADTMGTVNVHHCTLEWSFSLGGVPGAGGILTIQATGKPFFVECDQVNGALTKLVAPFVTPPAQ